MVLLFEISRENDGSNSGESRESRLTSCLDGELERSPAHQQRVKLRPKRGEIDFRIRANPVVFCITYFSHTCAPAELQLQILEGDPPFPI
jgi:hypothetical protein